MLALDPSQRYSLDTLVSEDPWVVCGPREFGRMMTVPEYYEAMDQAYREITLCEGSQEILSSQPEDSLASQPIKIPTKTVEQPEEEDFNSL